MVGKPSDCFLHHIGAMRKTLSVLGFESFARHDGNICQ